MTASPDAAHRRAVAARCARGEMKQAMIGSWEQWAATARLCVERYPDDPMKWCDDCALREAARLLREDSSVRTPRS